MIIGKPAKYTAVFIAVMILSLTRTVTVAAGTDVDWPSVPEVSAEAYVLMENNSSSILAGDSYNRRLYPASTTKILTCLVALENCSLDETVTFSETAVDLEEGSSNIGMQAGEQITVKDCLYALMIASANECANAIAEHVAGSVAAFAEMMNERAEEIGATSSHFTNPHGLFDIDHYTTAYDLCLIAKEAYENSTFVEIISNSSYTIAPTNKDPDSKELTTTVEMINPTSDYYNPAVIGGKTGYLNEAGRCLVVFAKQDDLTIISVALKAGYYTVFDDTQALLDYAFNNFTIKNISEEEKRFSYQNAASPVSIDASASIITLNDVSFDKLDSSVIFASDMTEEEYTEEATAAGILNSQNRTLFAAIEYSYQEHYLGKVYVFTDTDLTFTEASFVQVRYISYWYVCGGVIAVFLLMIITGRLAHIRRADYVRARRAAMKKRQH